MKGKRKEPTKIYENNSYDAEEQNKRQKRSRPVWGIEVSNVILTTKIMKGLERFFIKRVCPWDNKLFGMGYTESKQSFYFEFQNEAQQKAALCFDGHYICQNKMRVKRWNEDSVPLKQESLPPEKGDSDTMQSSHKSLPFPPAQTAIDEFGRNKKPHSSPETKGLSVDNGHSNIELKDRLLAAPNEHKKVLTAGNIEYEKRPTDQLSTIEELHVQLKKYQLLEKEKSLKKDYPIRKEDHNDMSECHEKDVQLRKHHSEMLSLKALLRDALAARNRQEQVIRVQNLNAIERLKNLREEKDTQQQVLISNIQTLETQVKDATLQNHQKEQMIRILNRNIEVAEERFQKLQNEKSNNQEEERLKIRCKKTEDELEALSHNFSVLKQHAAKNETELEKVAKMDIELEKVDAMRAFDRTNQASALAKLLEANKELSKRNTILAKDKDEWKRKANAVRAENEEIHRRCRANEGLHHALEDIKRDADSLYHRLRAEEEDKMRELRAMEEELTGKHRALRDAEMKVGELYSRLRRKDSALEDMHNDLKKIATENDELYARLKAINSALEDTHKDLKKSAIENDELCNRLKKKDTDIQYWQDEMNLKDNRLKTKDTDIKLMERIQLELNCELKEMRRNNDIQSSRHRSIEQGLQGELDGLKRQLKSASQERRHLVNQVRNNNDQHNREKDMLNAKLKRLQSDNNLLRLNSPVDLGVQKSNTDSERRMHDFEYHHELSHHGAKEAGMEEKGGKRQRVSHIQAAAMSHDAIVKREKQESSPQPQQEQQFRESIQELEAKLFKVVQDHNVLLEENQKLRREKKDMQQSISKFATKEGENEQLREEIEQMRMNHAMEIGLMDGSDESEEVANLKEELERAHQRIVELEGDSVPTSSLL